MRRLNFCVTFDVTTMMAGKNQAVLAVCAQTILIFPYIYILDVFTEKPYSKLLERNVV